MKRRKDMYRKRRKFLREVAKDRAKDPPGVHVLRYIGPKPKIAPWKRRENAASIAKFLGAITEGLDELR